MPSTMKKVKLEYDFQTNGETIPAGVQELPVEVAEDLERRQQTHKAYIESLVKSEEVNAAKLR